MELCLTSLLQLEPRYYFTFFSSYVSWVLAKVWCNVHVLHLYDYFNHMKRFTGYQGGKFWIPIAQIYPPCNGITESTVTMEHGGYHDSTVLEKHWGCLIYFRILRIPMFALMLWVETIVKKALVTRVWGNKSMGF
jgi:hypothetical protein